MDINLRTYTTSEKSTVLEVAGEVELHNASKLRGELQQVSIPGALEFVAAELDPGPGSPLAGKTAKNGKSTAYVCVGPVCSAPIYDPQSLQETLRRVRSPAPAPT